MTADAPCRDEEIYANAIAGLLVGAKHVAVGMVSPIPGTGALLAREKSGGKTRVSILGKQKMLPWTDGSQELFDLAGQGRLDGFFLSGGQIDRQANINLVGIGDYPDHKVRWSGSFGSGYLYFVVPRVILFRWEHTRRTLVEKVDFISAPGTSEPGVYRPGGPIALITNLCLFEFLKDRGRFRLKSVHPGHTLEEVRDNTGFDFDLPESVPETPVPDAATLETIRGPVATRIAEVYPVFARDVFGIEPAKAPDAA
ncbi:MAG: CoA-transferase [Rhodospirillaceae bacterium]